MGIAMAFIVLRRSRNTRSYYLVESYRDDNGKTQRRTLCYLGREQDGTDTLSKSLSHWEKIRDQSKKELGKSRGKRRQLLSPPIRGVRFDFIMLDPHIHPKLR
jgi:hypothetical protein